MKRKLAGILLCLGLALGLLPFAALAGAPSGHDCFSLDGNIWCDLCDEPLEHLCNSNDGDIRCDLCDALMKHNCRDLNRNGHCDLCTRPYENNGEPFTGDISGDSSVNMGDISMLYAYIRGTGKLY